MQRAACVHGLAAHDAEAQGTAGGGRALQHGVMSDAPALAMPLPHLIAIALVRNRGGAQRMQRPHCPQRVHLRAQRFVGSGILLRHLLITAAMSFLRDESSSAAVAPTSAQSESCMGAGRGLVPTWYARALVRSRRRAAVLTMWTSICAQVIAVRTRRWPPAFHPARCTSALVRHSAESLRRHRAPHPRTGGRAVQHCGVRMHIPYCRHMAVVHVYAEPRATLG